MSTFTPMKAIYLVKKGNPETAFETREVEQPKPGPGEVLIKSEGFGLNYSEVMARNGLYREAPPMPSVLGYEVVGEIIEIGKGTDQKWLGQRVVGFTRFGGYAEYAVTGEKGVVEIGDMDMGEATCLATQGVTAYYMAYEQLNLFEGDRVMIHAGAGGVGTLLIQLCKLKGCEVFANAGSDEKLDLMKELGADHVMNYRTQDYQEVIQKILGEERLDATFNPIAGKTFKKDFELVGSGGTVVLFGGSELSGGGFFKKLSFIWSMGLMLPIGLMMRSKSVVGTNMLKIGDNKIDVLNRCMRGMVSLAQEGKIKPVVGHTYNHTEIAKAHDLLESRKSKGKIVIEW